MSIQYSGGTLVNATGAITTKQGLVDLATTNLLTAGWTAITGTPGVSADVTMESASYLGQKVRFRFQDAGGATVSTIVTMKHASGSPTSQTAMLNPTGTWRIVANKYQFFFYMVNNPTTARAAVMGGQIWTPSWNAAASGDCMAWMQCIGVVDADATTRGTFRKRLRPLNSTDAAWSVITGATLTETTAYNSGYCCIATLYGGPGANTDANYVWADGSPTVIEPLIGWGGSAITVPGRHQGQVWDAIVVSGSWIGDQVITFDGHTWICITDTPGVNASNLASLFVAIT